jgi:hypothetical protein
MISTDSPLRHAELIERKAIIHAPRPAGLGARLSGGAR